MSKKTISLVVGAVAGIFSAFGLGGYAAVDADNANEQVVENRVKIEELYRRTDVCYINDKVLVSIQKDIEWIKKRLESE